MAFRRSVHGLNAATAALLAPTGAPAQTRGAVGHSGVAIVDPIWTTAPTLRAHGFMIGETPFALDG